MHYLFLAPVVLPLIFFLPGYFLVRAFFNSHDRIERLILSVFLTLAMIHGSVFAVDKLFKTVTQGKVAVAILAINSVCFAVFLLYRRKNNRFSRNRLMTVVSRESLLTEDAMQSGDEITTDNTDKTVVSVPIETIPEGEIEMTEEPPGLLTTREDALLSPLPLQREANPKLKRSVKKVSTARGLKKTAQGGSRIKKQNQMLHTKSPSQDQLS